MHLRIALIFLITPWLCGAAAHDQVSLWQWRAELGGEVSEAPHGILNLGIKNQNWSAQVYTDTLDIRYSKELSTGRAWLGTRVAAFAAELFFSPWVRGRHEPEQAIRATYGGLDGGYIHYLPRHFYLGAYFDARFYNFGALGDAVDTWHIPGDTWRLQGFGVMGYWTDSLQGKVNAGVDFLITGGVIRGEAELLWHPTGSFISPFLEHRSGKIAPLGLLSVSSIVQYRLGGLNPHVVPVAGMAWAEAWVDAYVAHRVGLEYVGDDHGVAGFVDHAYYLLSQKEARHALGVGVKNWFQVGAWQVTCVAGFAPVVYRPGASSIPAISGWFTLGRDWAPL